MSTLQSTTTRHRDQGLVRAAGVALGVLIAFAVAVVILASGRTTHNPITHQFQPVSVPAHAASQAHGNAGRQFLIDPGSGFPAPAH
jgi:hypothetical protein